jgi:hypothetical protein
MIGARALVFGAVFVAMTAGSSAAVAQRSDPAAAEALFREGRAAADAGDHATACKKFKESNRLDPAPGTVFNIADCEEKLGHLATAWTLFREVAQRLKSDDDRTAIATSRSAALEPRLPRLSIVLAPDAPPGARVFRDGVELQAGAFDTALPVDPGKHLLAVEAPQHERAEATVSLREGEAKRETLSAGKPAPASGHGGARRTVGFVIGGLGLAAAGVGAVTGILVLDRKSTVDDNCDAAKRCNPTGAEAADSGRTLAPISTVSLVAGGVALAAGVVLVLTSGSSDRESRAALTVGPGRLDLSARF